jgi:hypothetical protein
VSRDFFIMNPSDISAFRSEELVYFFVLSCNLKLYQINGCIFHFKVHGRIFFNWYYCFNYSLVSHYQQLLWYSWYPEWNLRSTVKLPKTGSIYLKILNKVMIVIEIIIKYFIESIERVFYPFDSNKFHSTLFWPGIAY